MTPALAWVALSALLAVLYPETACGEFLLGPPPGEEPTKVSVGLYLSDVYAVSEQEETMDFDGILTLRWHDGRNAFDPIDAGVSEKVYQGNFQFSEVYSGWWPQLVLANKGGDYQVDGVVLRIGSDGAHTLIQEVSADAEVRMKLRRFPFDRQHFDAIFEVLGTDTDRVVLVPDPATTGSRTGSTNLPQWDVKDIRIASRDFDVDAHRGEGRMMGSSRVVVTLDVTRKSTYMLRVVVVPLAVIVCLTFAVFWMDRESLGDRMDISFIGVLSVIAYQIIVSQTMPSIAYFTLMSGFLYSTYLLLSAGVVVNLVVSKLDQAGRRDLGDRVDFTCRWAFPLVFVGLNAASAFYFFVIE